MKLQAIMKNTGLSKKTIYYYIDEGFITPEKNEGNGYFEFSPEDEEKLTQICSFRKIGLSIQDIKDMLRYPTLTNFFVHRHINATKVRISTELAHLNAIYALLDSIPANATPPLLQKTFSTLNFESLEDSSLLNMYFPNVDSRMIAILIWAPFMEVECGEYRKFLWEKISNELRMQLDDNFIYLSTLIYQLSLEQISATSERLFFSTKSITNAPMHELAKFEDYLFQQCVNMTQSVTLQNYWNLCYTPILSPTFSFYNSHASMLLQEYNPRYADYTNKMQIICKNVVERLHQNNALYARLMQVLNNQFHPEANHYAELICLYTFHESIYTQLDIDLLHQLVLGSSDTTLGR
ncbi:MAG: MerR family transcriptional regulator [Angelakisella sp.]